MRVVVVDHNGGALTIGALRSLEATAWPSEALDLVVVDNGSAEPIATRVATECPTVRVIRSETNRGFAGGNNLALADLDGVDLVALVNNDVTVPPEWLSPLVEALRADERRGAASPKMLFEGRYRRLDLSTDPERPWPLDRRERGVRVVDVRPAARREPPGSVRYASGFYEPEQRDATWFRWSMAGATMFVPVDDDGEATSTCRIVLDVDRDKRVELCSGAVRTVLETRRGCRTYDVGLGGDRVDLVNNVGSVLLADLYAADRGWLEPDDGRYDAEEDVFAWSGGAVLLRADCLRDIGVFDERLFLYYEDLELAWRGRARGWQFRYVPSSVVRHRHAATAVQDSPASRYFNERNRLLVLARHAPAGMVTRAVVRYLTSTASYFVRDVVAPLARGARPNGAIVRTRVRAFGGFLSRVPAQLRDRWRQR